MQYTDNQLEAINFDEGNLLILACAGSGKTEVISRRIAKLVGIGVPKESIMAFTFTEKAAESLKTRIRKHLEELNPSEPMLGDLRVGTIHSIALKLLKELNPEYRKYEVLDEQKQAAFVATNYFRLGLNQLGGRYGETIRKFLNTLNAIYIKKIGVNQIEDR